MTTLQKIAINILFIAVVPVIVIGLGVMIAFDFVSGKFK